MVREGQKAMGVGIRCLQSWRVHGDGDQPITTGHARKIPCQLIGKPSNYLQHGHGGVGSRLAASEFRESEAALYSKLYVSYADNTTVSFCCPCDYQGTKMPRGKEGDVPSLDTGREETRPVLSGRRITVSSRCSLTEGRWVRACDRCSLATDTAAAAMGHGGSPWYMLLLQVFTIALVPTHPINCSNWGWRCFQRGHPFLTWTHSAASGGSIRIWCPGCCLLGWWSISRSPCSLLGDWGSLWAGVDANSARTSTLPVSNSCGSRASAHHMTWPWYKI